MGKGLKFSLKAFKKPLLTEEEYQLLSYLQREGDVSCHLKCLKEEAKSREPNLTDSLQEQIQREFINRVAQLYYKKQLVIDNIRREDRLEIHGTSALAQLYKCLEDFGIRYQSIPDFFKDRIQRYGILSLFMLIFGSFMGTWMKDRTFIFWSFVLGLIGFIRTYLIFRTADKRNYEIVEGLVTGIDGKNPFARLRKIRISDPAGRQSELLLDKNVKVLEGKRYRFYFGINEKKLVGIRRVDAALNNGTFLGNEEI